MRIKVRIKMKFLIDILHPAHVQFFKNFIKEMSKEGHEFLVTTRKKDIALDLLDLYGIKYHKLSELKSGFFNLLIELIYRNFKFHRIAKRFKPDVMMGLMGPTIATAGIFLKGKKVVFWDTENSVLSNLVVYPLVDYVVTPSCYEGKVYGRHVTYPGYHELAYLHPNRFKPNPAILKKYKIDTNKRFFLLRFVSWGTYHERNEAGFTDKVGFVRGLEKYGRVYITSEVKLPKELEKNRLKMKYSDFHDVLAFSSLYVGESATIASEAAVLGIPAIYVSTSRRGYTNEEDRKYGLVFNYSTQRKALQKAKELLRRKNLKQEWQEKRETMLKDKVDVTKWIIDFFKKKI